MHTRLLTVRSLLRLAFNGVNVLEGRPIEEYPVQSPPGVASRRRHDSATSGTTTDDPSTRDQQVNDYLFKIQDEPFVKKPTEVLIPFCLWKRVLLFALILCYLTSR